MKVVAISTCSTKNSSKTPADREGGRNMASVYQIMGYYTETELTQKKAGIVMCPKGTNCKKVKECIRCAAAKYDKEAMDEVGKRIEPLAEALK